MPELSSKQWSQFLALLGKLKFFIVDPIFLSHQLKTKNSKKLDRVFWKGG